MKNLSRESPTWLMKGTDQQEISAWRDRFRTIPISSFLLLSSSLLGVRRISNRVNKSPYLTRWTIAEHLFSIGSGGGGGVTRVFDKRPRWFRMKGARAKIAGGKRPRGGRRGLGIHVMHFRSPLSSSPPSIFLKKRLHLYIPFSPLLRRLWQKEVTDLFMCHVGWYLLYFMSSIFDFYHFPFFPRIVILLNFLYFSSFSWFLTSDSLFSTLMIIHFNLI